MTVKVAMCLCYYIFSATPTTDILRLLKGASTPINTWRSYCDHCGHEIRQWEQLPVISYVLCKGKCRCCGAKIPVRSVFVEGFTFIMMVGVTAAFQFRLIGVALSFLGYELLKIACLLSFGRRELSFWKEFLVSMSYNMGFFGLFLLMSAILCII